jgi:ketosteroid isomerase-like protein
MSNKYKEIIEKINASFTEGNTEGFLEYCNDDLKWSIAGDQTVEGKEAVRTFMGQMEGCEPPVFTVDALVTDDQHAVLHGDMTMKDKEGKTSSYRYCDFYRFENDKVAELTSYIVETKKEQTNVSN